MDGPNSRYTQLDQRFHTQFHQNLRVQGSSIYHQERSHKPKNDQYQVVMLAEKWRMEVAVPFTERLILVLSPFPVSDVLCIREPPRNDISFSASFPFVPFIPSMIAGKFVQHASPPGALVSSVLADSLSQILAFSLAVVHCSWLILIRDTFSNVVTRRFRSPFRFRTRRDPSDLRPRNAIIWRQAATSDRTSISTAAPAISTIAASSMSRKSSFSHGSILW